MKVKVKKLNENAKLPEKTHDSDFCFDCYATSVEEVAKDVYKYGIGLAFQIERGKEKIGTIKEAIEMRRGRELINSFLDFNTSDKVRLSLDFRPRSSIYKTGMLLSNSTGTIDEDYRGEVSAIFYHINKKLPIYKVGERIGQIKLGLTFDIDWVEVDELSDSNRGTGGFGSTGQK